MALSNGDQARIREFLLGKLSGDEQQKLEERLMVEEELFEEFEVSKGELVEEYCAGELTEEEQLWFEHNFLASNEGKEKYAFALALDRLDPPAQAPVLPQRLTFLDRLRTLLKLHPWALATATSAALLVVIGAAALLTRPPGQTVIGPTLASNAVNREEGPLPTKITLPSNTAELKIRLLLPQPSTPATRYRAVLDDRTETVPVNVVEYDAEAVWVSISATQLPRGEYSLRLFATGSDGTERPIDYFFNIE